ncbi:MAG: ABC transporter permease subunit [Defluviitaleaceae bacterium]|nr:ABC transporter permease subunit [Defluviitaleaceae bacterium]
MIKYKAFKIAVILCGICVIATATFIFGYVFFMGFHRIDINFITDRPRGIPLGTEGGVFPAIMGTVYLGALSGFIAGIVGSITAIFLVFYCRNKFLKGIIVFSTYFLAGMPSILFGIVGYTILIYMLGMPRSLLTAGITVSVMIVPFITIRIVKSFKEDILDMMNSSLCLGLPKWYIIKKFILPNYLINIMTSISLGMTYGAGAAAPIIFTGAVIFAETPGSITQPFMNLSYHLFILVNEGISFENAYGSALILMFLLLGINIFCRILEHLREGADWRFGKGKQ